MQSRITLYTDKSLAAVLVDAGVRAALPYSRTPLDFIKPPPDDKSLTAPFWVGINSIYRITEDLVRRPVTCFANHRVMPPKGITVRERIYGICVEFVYFGLHFLGLLLEFPTRLERFLWLAATSTLFGLLLIYLFGVYVGHKYQAYLSMRIFGQKTNSILEFVEMVPRWGQIAIHGPVIFLYVLARTYILAEGFLSLRALPAEVYGSVDWSNFFPHIV